MHIWPVANPDLQLEEQQRKQHPLPKWQPWKPPCCVPKQQPIANATPIECYSQKGAPLCRASLGSSLFVAVGGAKLMLTCSYVIAITGIIIISRPTNSLGTTTPPGRQAGRRPGKSLIESSSGATCSANFGLLIDSQERLTLSKRPL